MCILYSRVRRLAIFNININGWRENDVAYYYYWLAVTS